MQLPSDFVERPPLITDYRSLRAAFAARRKELGLTQNELDYLVFLADGHIGKLECGTKRFGDISLAAVRARWVSRWFLCPLRPKHQRH
jgi:hypothetical protein